MLEQRVLLEKIFRCKKQKRPLLRSLLKTFLNICKLSLSFVCYYLLSAPISSGIILTSESSVDIDPGTSLILLLSESSVLSFLERTSSIISCNPCMILLYILCDLLLYFFLIFYFPLYRWFVILY